MPRRLSREGKLCNIWVCAWQIIEIGLMSTIGGASSAVFARWRSTLLKSMAHVEAYIDFGEDEGIEDDAFTNALVEVPVY